jgi:hypothetical protein
MEAISQSLEAEALIGTSKMVGPDLGLRHTLERSHGRNGGHTVSLQEVAADPREKEQRPRIEVEVEVGAEVEVKVHHTEIDDQATILHQEEAKETLQPIEEEDSMIVDLGEQGPDHLREHTLEGQGQ